MRRKEKEITDKAIINSVLDEALVCRIALCDNNKPYIIPMSFGFKDDCIYFHSATEGRKIDVLKQNNNVCFEVDIKDEIEKLETPCSWTMKYYSVIGCGKASFVDNVDKKKEALNIIMEKYSGKSDFEFPEEALDKLVIIKIEIDEVTGKKSKY